MTDALASGPVARLATIAEPHPPVSAARVFVALLSRDLRVARRELPFFLIRTIMQPVLFVIVFGYLLPKMGFTQGNYRAALLPGILALSLMLSSAQSVTLPMVTEFGWTKEIEDRLLAPISIDLVAIEKIVNAMIQGIIAALVVLPIARLVMGPVAGFTFSHVPELLLVVILSAATASAFGLLLGVLISPQQIGFMFSLIITPMIFFGCAYYPWRGLDVVPWLKYAVLVNPLVYISEGLRAALTPGMPHMPFLAIVTALVVLTAVFTKLALVRFRIRALG
ncbi:MAG: ABC transporter permease [Gemmatimonadota bacterium]|nr:ABC transporter permease [Gemmatimonadota bacterium]